MDFSTIIGIVAGIVLIVWGIGMKSIGNFISFSSFIIVFGGTVASLVASFPFKVLKDVPHHFKILLQSKRYDHKACIDTLVEFAQVARRNGLLSLEEKTAEVNDPFFQYAVMLIVDAHDPANVKELLNNELDYLSERHENGISIYERGSALAPAFGMIGTLIGLINMLMGINLEEGASSTLGQDMSIALVTTFYGSVLANLFFAPIAKKLMLRDAEEYLYKQLIIEGVLAIQSGDNPKFLREKLNCYLEQRRRDIEETGGEEQEKGKKKAKGGRKKGK